VRYEVRIVIRPVAYAEALHDQTIQEERQIGTDNLVALNLVQLVHEEERPPSINIQLVFNSALHYFLISVGCSVLIDDWYFVLLRLGSLPVYQIDIERALIEVDLEDDEEKFGARNPSKEPIILLKVLPVRLVRWHEAVDALLKLEEDEPVAYHEEDVPEVQCTEEVKQVHERCDEPRPALVVLVL